MREWLQGLLYMVVLLTLCTATCVLVAVTGKQGRFSVWSSMLFTSGADFESELARCSRGPKYLPARRPGDLNETFTAILESNQFAQYAPRVLSRDPWIVYFDRFMTEAEVSEYEDTVFSLELVRSSTAADSSILNQLVTRLPFVESLRRRFGERKSFIRQCDGRCRTAPIIVAVQERASNLSRVPLENFETVQPFTYKEGGFYKPHFDNGNQHHLLAPGSRLYTFLIYTTTVKVGGGTRFPELDLEVPAKRGAAVLFTNTRDEDPMKTDNRTLHEGMKVIEGEKRGVNLWLHQYNHVEFEAARCTGDDLGRRLAYHNKAAIAETDMDKPRRVPGQPIVTFSNLAEKAVRVFWVEAKTEQETLIKLLEPGGAESVMSFTGHKFHVRTGGDGALLQEYVVGKEKDDQLVVIGTNEAVEL